MKNCILSETFRCLIIKFSDRASCVQHFDEIFLQFSIWKKRYRVTEVENHWCKMFWYAQFPYIERLKYHKRFILIDCGNGLTDDGMKNLKSSGGLPYCIIYSNNVTWFFWTLMVQHFPTVLVNTSIVRKKNSHFIDTMHQKAFHQKYKNPRAPLS